MAENTAVKSPSPEPLVEALRICVPDTKRLIEDVAKKAEGRVGWLTWIIAAICLPIIGIGLFCTIFLIGGSAGHVLKAAALKNNAKHNIYMVDISNGRQTQQKMAGIRACLELNKNLDLYLINIYKADQPRNLTHLDQLKEENPNFHYVTQNVNTFFWGSYFNSSIKKRENPRVTLLKAQLLTLWRYGGVILSPLWLPLKSFDDKIINKDGTLTIGVYNDRIGFMSVERSCNPVVFELMREMKNINTSATIETDIINRVALKSEYKFDELGFPLLCNNNTRNDEAILMRMNSNGVLVKISTSKRMSSQTNLLKKESVPPNVRNEPAFVVPPNFLKNAPAFRIIPYLRRSYYIMQ